MRPPPTSTLSPTATPLRTITTCAPNQSAFANGLCQAPVPDFTTGEDATDRNFPLPLSVPHPPTARTLVRLGVTTVTLPLNDGATNESTCTATLTATATHPP